MIPNPANDVAQVRFRVEAVYLCRFDDRETVTTVPQEGSMAQVRSRAREPAVRPAIPPIWRDGTDLSQSLLDASNSHAELERVFSEGEAAVEKAVSGFRRARGITL